MLPVCRTASAGFAIPTFVLLPPDVEGFPEELEEFQSAFHVGNARSRGDVIRRERVIASPLLCSQNNTRLGSCGYLIPTSA